MQKRRRGEREREGDNLVRGEDRRIQIQSYRREESNMRVFACQLGKDTKLKEWEGFYALGFCLQ